MFTIPLITNVGDVVKKLTRKDIDNTKIKIDQIFAYYDQPLNYIRILENGEKYVFLIDEEDKHGQQSWFVIKVDGPTYKVTDYKTGLVKSISELPEDYDYWEGEE